MATKQWFVPAGLFKPLCGNAFQPVEGQGNCELCTAPVKVEMEVVVVENPVAGAGAGA
jgi:hypothetical protein